MPDPLDDPTAVDDEMADLAFDDPDDELGDIDEDGLDHELDVDPDDLDSDELDEDDEDDPDDEDDADTDDTDDTDDTQGAYDDDAGVATGVEPEIDLEALDQDLGASAADLDDEEDDDDGLREGEFVCRSCFMAKRTSALADPDRMLCRDCA